MFKKKVETTEKAEASIKEQLIDLLKAKTPNLFDRTPTLTGDVNKLADEILRLIE